MKACLIAPNNLKKWEHRGDAHFIIGDPEMPEHVRKFYKNSSRTKIMDNGVWETGKPMDQDEYLALANELEVDEIVLPDYLHDGAKTYLSAVEFMETTSKEFSYVYVPQGKNPLDWVNNYEVPPNGIDIIGIPVWLQKEFGCRAGIINYLWKTGLWEPYPHHLLGCEDLYELYSMPRDIRSIDTSLPFSAAQAETTMWYNEPHDRVNLGGAIIDPVLLKIYIHEFMRVVHEC